MAPLTAAEVQNHPEYGTVVWDLKPVKQGELAVAKTRGGPFNIAYEIHGNGPIKMVWIMGLGSFMASWQRQTKDFGHSQNTNSYQSPKYQNLVYDNRGMGKSDKPLFRYSTSEMAIDVIELVDHMGWTSQRQLHIIGISMGGMIAQELALMIPERIASLTLAATGPRIFKTVGFFENIRQRLDLLLPKSVDVKLAELKLRLFSEQWLDEPDAEGHFPTNGDRFAAQEINKKSDGVSFTTKGFLLQLIAAGWHHKTPAQIAELGDKVGRERIQVIHGDLDRMITAPHGETLAKELGGEERGVTVVIVKGKGHGLPMEWRKDFTKTIAALVEKTEAMPKD